MGNFAVSDLHGCYNLWHQIQSFCKDSDRIFVLGDCIDRGPDSLKTLKSVMNDSRVLLLKGNHEQMFQFTLEEERDFGRLDEQWAMWSINGGTTTYDDWQADGCKYDWISILKHLPTYASYTNIEGDEIFMTHSGTVPNLLRKSDGKPVVSEHKALWDRDHIAHKWNCVDKNLIIVHGHTPILYMLPKKAEFDGGAFWYCDGHKCNIDNASFATNMTCLLDLDTFDEHIFMG